MLHPLLNCHFLMGCSVNIDFLGRLLLEGRDLGLGLAFEVTIIILVFFFEQVVVEAVNSEAEGNISLAA